MQISRYDPIAKKDLAQLQHDNPSALPVVVQLASSDPRDDASLEVVPLPPLDEGPYLGYAVQWFLFCIVAVCGWFLLAWRHAERLREQAAEARDGARAA
jgi:cytochrome oxidase assembly protein ShyY1